MTDAELRGYRRRLLDLARRVVGEVRDLWDVSPAAEEGEAGAGSPDDLTDAGDAGGHEYEEQVDHALAGNEELLLEEITAALDRINKGTFGRCGACGRPVGHDRLRAVPYARFCAACARREEAASG